jgi:hypothetical protein
MTRIILNLCGFILLFAFSDAKAQWTKQGDIEGSSSLKKSFRSKNNREWVQMQNSCYFKDPMDSNWHLVFYQDTVAEIFQLNQDTIAYVKYDTLTQKRQINISFDNGNTFPFVLNTTGISAYNTIFSYGNKIAIHYKDQNNFNIPQSIYLSSNFGQTWVKRDFSGSFGINTKCTNLNGLVMLKDTQINSASQTSIFYAPDSLNTISFLTNVNASPVLNNFFIEDSVICTTDNHNIFKSKKLRLHLVFNNDSCYLLN